MALPTRVVEFSPATDPFDTPSWVDVTQYVREIPELVGGREAERREASPGHGQLVLRNDDRRFDPTNTSSPYAPDLVPDRRLRIRATWDGTTHGVFSGFVRDWPPDWPDVNTSTVTVDVVDVLDVLERMGAPASVWAQEIPTLTPRFWHRLNDRASDGRALDSSGNGYHATVLGGPTFGQSSLHPFDPDHATTFDGVDDRLVVPREIWPSGIPGINARHVTVALIVQTQPRVVDTGDPIGLRRLIDQREEDFALPSVGLWITDDRETAPSDPGTLVFSTSVDGAASSRTWRTDSRLDDGEPHLVVARYTHVPGGSITMNVRVDGVEDGAVVGSTSGPVQTRLAGGAVAIGGPAAGTAGEFLDGTLDEALFWAGYLSDGSVEVIEDAFLHPWAGDTTGERIDKLLDLAGWPAADRAIDVGNSTMQAANLGSSFLAALRDAETTESGFLFVDGDGKVTFYERHRILKPPYTASQATFGDGGPGSGELPYTKGGLRPEGGERDLFTEVVVSRENGSPQVARSSSTQFTTRTLTVERSQLETDAEALDQAHFLLARHEVYTPRIRGLRFHPPDDDAALFPEALGRKLWDRITARRRPPGGGPLAEQQAHIEGFAHRNITQDDWGETEWFLSPAETQAYWIAGTSQVGIDTRAGW